MSDTNAPNSTHYSRALADQTRLHDRYEIVREVAQGGFGITYEANDLEESRNVAIKELLPTELAHREGDGISVRTNSDDEAFDIALTEFAEEADRLHAFDHPNIVKFLDYFTANGTGYLVMEWLQDRTLRSMLTDQSGKRLVIGQEQLLAYLRGLLDGLEAIHAAGHIHRDIKPDNICLREDDTPVILDFGASRALGGQRTLMTGMATDGFGPLEQYLDDWAEQGPWSDLYALGATLYACVAGQDSVSALKRSYEISRGGMDPLAEIESSEYSPALLKTIVTLMNLDRSRRPADVGSVRKALRYLLNPSRTSDPAAANKKNNLKPGDIWRDPLSDGTPGPEMVLVPKGQFRMGDLTGKGFESERPVHSVNITRPFLIGRYVVMVGDYRKFAEATGWDVGQYDVLPGERQPAISVSWNDAHAYIDWLSMETGSVYRLPSEAEWEYAARAGAETDYPWGNRPGRNRMNTEKSGSRWSGKWVASVGSFCSNAFGLYDTSGNVWEWCEDVWHSDYEDAPIDSNAWLQGGDRSHRVLRGGSWGDKPGNARSSHRDGDNPTNRSGYNGFRLVQDL